MERLDTAPLLYECECERECECHIDVRALCGAQNYVYAVGGNDGTNSVDSCERFDPVLDKWTMCAVMHYKRAGAGLAELGGSLFVVGALRLRFHFSHSHSHIASNVVCAFSHSSSWTSPSSLQAASTTTCRSRASSSTTRTRTSGQSSTACPCAAAAPASQRSPADSSSSADTTARNTYRQSSATTPLATGTASCFLYRATFAALTVLYQLLY